jgi:hypothetical protein
VVCFVPPMAASTKSGQSESSQLVPTLRKSDRRVEVHRATTMAEVEVRDSNPLEPLRRCCGSGGESRRGMMERGEPSHNDGRGGGNGIRTPSSR